MGNKSKYKAKKHKKHKKQKSQSADQRVVPEALAPPEVATADRVDGAVDREISLALETPDLAPRASETGDHLPSLVVEPSRDAWSRRPPFLLLGLTIIANLWICRAERLPVAYPNDSAVHSLSVAFALHIWRSGHLPLSSWFPFLSLGSPFLMHYQSSPAIIAGLVATIFGAANTFSWMLYLLLALWPLVIYRTARLFELDRWPAAVAAAAAPFVMSVTGYGFEHQAYDWLGNGLWPQLFGMWMLPLAWGYCWQAIRYRRHLFAAPLTLGATIAFHFLTGFLAGLGLVVLVLVGAQLLERLRRGLLVAGIALLATAWVTLPILLYSKWNAINELQIHTFWDDSYGAKRILSWLVTGRIYDSGRFPVITVLVFAGLASCLWRIRRDEVARVFIGLWMLSLFLYFGRPTLGPVLNLLPFSKNIFFQRYNTGVQLIGILLAGVGAVAIVDSLRWLVRRFVRRSMRSRTSGAIAVFATVLALMPAWSQLLARGSAEASAISIQRQSDLVQGAELNSLLAQVRASGGGRIYAGMASNWGRNFLVGGVPVYIYLTDVGIDAIGFTLRTSSLMSNPETYFNDSNPGDYSLFGVHYLVLPTGTRPLVSARLVRESGPYSLWVLPTGGYVQVVDTIGSITAATDTLGRQSAFYLDSSLPASGLYLTVAYAGAAAAAPTLTPHVNLSRPRGKVLTEYDNLLAGEVRTMVHTTRTAVVVLKASYDPGWIATVDGVRTPTQMIAPALVGVRVSPGTHIITFAYQGFGAYPLLFELAALVFLLWALLLFVISRRRRRLSESG